MHRLLALMLGTAIALCILAIGLSIRGHGISAFIGVDPDIYSELGFSASYEMPKKRPDDWCGFDNGGSTSRPWAAGPHSGFDGSDPVRLATDSLAWFRDSSEAAAWRENPTAKLQLGYPSGSTRITACYAPASTLSWGDQLRTWFRRFPPNPGATVPRTDSSYHWTVSFPDSGEIRGDAESDLLGVAAIRDVLAARSNSTLFESPTCSLEYTIRTSSHSMDCYSVETANEQDIDELRPMLRRKLMENRGESGSETSPR